MAAASVQTDKTAESLAEFFKELDGIRRPIPSDELARAKNYLAFGFPAEFETIAALAAKVEEQLLYDLPSDVFSRYVEQIQAVSATDVAKVAEKYIQPEKLMVVVVGDRKTVEGPIRKLNLGPVALLSIDDVMGPIEHP